MTTICQQIMLTIKGGGTGGGGARGALASPILPLCVDISCG